MSGWFELKKAPSGQFRFNLKAGNAETVLTSESYKAKASAKNGIASVQKNCGKKSNFNKLVAKNGKFYFTLKAANNQIIGNSQMYASESGRDNGVESVMKNGKSKTVKEV